MTKAKEATKKRSNGLGTVVQRGDKWRWMLTLGYTPVTDPATGATRMKRQSINGTCKSETEAHKALARAVTDHHRGLLAPSDTITLREYSAIWLERQTNLRPSSVREYRRELAYINAIIGERRVKDLRPAHIKDAMVLLSKTTRKDKPALQLSNRTVSKCITRLRSISREAVLDQIIYVNPADGVRLARGGRLDRVATTLDFPDASRFHALGWALWHAGMADAWIGLCLCIGVGLRRGEALGLTWQHIDFSGGTMRVAQSLRRVTKRDGPDLGDVKTYASRREIVLPASLTDALRQHRALQLEWKVAAGRAWSDTGCIVSTHLGGWPQVEALNVLLERVIEWSNPARPAAGAYGVLHGVPIRHRDSLEEIIGSGKPLPDIRLHDLRHSYATLALRSGVPVEVVSHNLGHAKISITLDLYRHVLDSERRQNVFDVFAGQTPAAPRIPLPN